LLIYYNLLQYRQTRPLNVKIRAILLDAVHFLSMADRVEDKCGPGMTSIFYVVDQVAHESGIEKCELLSCTEKTREGLDSDDPDDWSKPAEFGQICVTLQGYGYDYSAESESVIKMCKALSVSRNAIIYRYPVEEWDA
jgi:hypothetical protein